MNKRRTVMKFKFKIEGIDCPMCASKLATRMSEIDGVDYVTINFLSERLTVDTTLSEDVLIAELKKTAKAFDSAVKIK
jgi:copper chaperone CopZ